MNFLTAIYADVPTKGDAISAPAPAWYDLGFWDYTLIVFGLVLVYFFIRYRPQIVKFVGEVRVELDKCSWPWDPNQTGFKKYKELRDSTVVVILSVILLAGFVTSSDFLLTHLVGFLTGTGLMHVGTATATVPPVHS